VLELKNGRHGEGAQQRNKEGRSLAHLGTPWSKTKLRSQSLERRSYPPLERRAIIWKLKEPLE
jgi:hypothetical protein